MFSKMKNIIRTLLAAALLLPTSCQDFLEINPVSSFGPDYIFGNVINAEKALYGVYGTLGGDQAYGIRLSLYYTYDNDEMMGQGGNPFPDNERRDIAHFNVQPSNTQLAGPFNQLYRGVERANICIYNIPRMEQYENGTESEKRDLRMMHGEALTLRAQLYFELIRNWGDIPAFFQPSSFEENLFKGKTDRDEIYDQLLEDLALATELVPWASESGIPTERITKGAVRALRARIALFRGGYSLRLNRNMERPSNYLDFYEIARDECKAIIDRGEHNLDASFEAVFRNGLLAKSKRPSGEVIWEVGMSGGSSTTGDSKLGYYNGPRYNNIGNSALTILPSFFYAFDPNDLRRDVTCAPYNINQDFTLAARPLQQMVDGKFRRDWITNPTAIGSAAQYFGVNWPMIRFSDVLLMYAEAENELNNGPTGAAIAAFEEVRTRGFGGNASLIGTTPASYQGFFEAIMRERSFELAGEGLRKYDLIRWNKLGERIGQVQAELLAMSNREAPYDALPEFMYYESNSAGQFSWLTSFYEPSPEIPPAPEDRRVAWVGSDISTVILQYYAVGFTPGKSELLPIHTSIIDTNPNITQDYGY